MAWARVSTDDGSWSYQLTDEDFDLAVRAVWGEIGEHASTWETDAHLWALLHTQYLLGLPSFAEAIRQYSRWTYKSGWWHEYVLTVHLSDVEPAVLERVARWFRGSVPVGDFHDLRHFAECDRGTSNMGRPADIVGPSGDCYWRYAGTLPPFVFAPGSSWKRWAVALGAAALVTAAAGGVAVVAVRRKVPRSALRTRRRT